MFPVKHLLCSQIVPGSVVHPSGCTIGLLSLAGACLDFFLSFISFGHQVLDSAHENKYLSHICIYRFLCLSFFPNPSSTAFAAITVDSANFKFELFLLYVPTS